MRKKKTCCDCGCGNLPRCTPLKKNKLTTKGGCGCGCNGFSNGGCGCNSSTKGGCGCNGSINKNIKLLKKY
jgi:hypothetical protein